MIGETAIRERHAAIKDRLDERSCRLFVAAEKLPAGHGGTAAVSWATGVAHSAIIRGGKDLLTAPAGADRVRRQGGSPPISSEADPTVLEDQRRLVEPATMGDPTRRLLLVSKSREELAAALRNLNHAVCVNAADKMLTRLGYSRQVNRKMKEGSRHPGRDRHFQHINRQVMALQATGHPAGLSHMTFPKLLQKFGEESVVPPGTLEFAFHRSPGPFQLGEIERQPA